MDAEAIRRTSAEMDRLKAELDRRGIKWRCTREGTPVVSFDNEVGECRVFPSQTYEGKLFVSYSTFARCDTADEVLGVCEVPDAR